MFRFQRLRVHLAVAQRMELVGDQRQLPLPIRLGPVAAVAVAPAELFKLVVQFSHGVLAFG